MRKESANQKAAKFQRDVRSALRLLKDAERAAGAKAYMRGKFDYLGIGTPGRRAAVAELIRGFKPATAEELRAAATGLWACAEREYQYVAADLLIKYQARLSLDDLPWLLELAQQKSWWDTVDCLVKVVGKIVRRSGAKGVRAMDRAVKHNDLWVRRIAMLHQLGWRAECDTERLFRYAELLAAEKEFFIRKAIGWALRDYAWHNPTAIATFIATSRDILSPLTVREAGKNLTMLLKSAKTPAKRAAISSKR
jgi:3-methyladenine DNA glycosylase AlkD